MKLAIGPITSASNLVPVALATALLVFGIVMCAVAAPPSLAQSPGTAASLSSTLCTDRSTPAGVAVWGIDATTGRLGPHADFLAAF